MSMRRKEYFEKNAGSPESIFFNLKRRVNFNEVDVMGIVWYGRYAIYFEEALRELGRRCGLSYLDEEFTIKASLVWSEGAKINTEYEIIKEDGSIATRGYTIQVLVEARSAGEACIIVPELIERLHKRWLAGEFKCLK